MPDSVRGILETVTHTVNKISYRPNFQGDFGFTAITGIAAAIKTFSSPVSATEVK
jgi:hypothetical protein